MGDEEAFSRWEVRSWWQLPTYHLTALRPGLTQSRRDSNGSGLRYLLPDTLHSRK